MATEVSCKKEKSKEELTENRAGSGRVPHI